jgi:hypothetical protein
MVFPLWFLTMGSSSNRKLLRIRAKSVVFIRCLHLHIRYDVRIGGIHPVNEVRERLGRELQIPPCGRK